MWRKIKLAKPTQAQDAFVTIGNGQMHFGIAACRLMPTCLDNKYVEFFRCDKEYLIGVAFTNEASPDSITIQRHVSQAQKKPDAHTDSFTVVSKHAMQRAFGDIGIAPTSVKCKVTVDEDSHNMFVIDLRNAKKAKEPKHVN